MSGPFQWRDADCASAACAAFAELWGRDPMGDLRGAYNSSFGALRRVLRAGGYLALMQRCATRHGLQPTDAPQAGDLVAIDGPMPLGAVLTLCIQPGEFAGKGPSGMSITRGSILEAWTWRH